MFEYVKDREQEIALLKFAKFNAQCLKHNIEELEKLEPIYKSDGTIHKTKMKEREVLKRRFENEYKRLKRWFNEHKMKGESNDYKRYSYRGGVSDNRDGVYSIG